MIGARYCFLKQETWFTLYPAVDEDLRKPAVTLEGSYLVITEKGK